MIATDTAESIGEVKGFVLDGGGRRIESIHIDGHGKRSTLLGWSSVAAFGADAVMASSATDPATIENDHQKSAVKGTVTMIGTKVLTVRGRQIGMVEDVEFDTESGEVVRVVTAHEAIEADRLRALGSYSLVVGTTGAGADRG